MAPDPRATHALSKVPPGLGGQTARLTAHLAAAHFLWRLLEINDTRTHIQWELLGVFGYIKRRKYTVNCQIFCS